MTDQSWMSRIGAKVAPAVSKRLFPSSWIEAGDDRTRLLAIAKKRRSSDGPRPDVVLQRKWSRVTTDVVGHPLHVLTPSSGSTGRVLFYCHGGAFVVGPSAFEWLHAARFAHAIGHDLALYEYPKVPEHDSLATQPATIEAYNLVAGRYSPDRIALAGLSAGGGLALSVVQRLQRAGRELPRAVALFSPWLDMTVAHPDAADYVASDQLLPIECLRRDGVLYAGANSPTDPLVSPRFIPSADLGSFPPTVLTAGDQEILLPEGREFVDKLVAAGVRASLHVEAYGQHAGVAAKTPEGSAVFERAADDMRSFIAMDDFV